jgi:predicted transcriptional regulator
MLNPLLHDGPAEVALMSDLQKEVIKSIYEASGEGLRLWQVQKKVSGSKSQVQEALHELLAAGYIGILSMGGGPKYHKIASKAYILAALDVNR